MFLTINNKTIGAPIKAVKVLIGNIINGSKIRINKAQKSMTHAPKSPEASNK